MSATRSHVERVLAGDARAVARMITRAETRAPGAGDEIAELFRSGGRAWIVGLTGAPGTGKSTLASALTVELRRRGATVGIVAVDPSSPYSGGAILGDRIRLSGLESDPGVFIRSMATRGALGGIARATADAITVLDAAGMDYVLVETVGVGQDEIDIVSAVHAVVVVSVPGLGDDVQAMKAGILEIADIHVVNKADRDGADRTVADLRSMLSLGGAQRAGLSRPAIVKTVAATAAGVDELADELDRHRRALVESGGLAARARAMAERQVQALAQRILVDHLQGPARGEAFERAVEEVCARRLDPASAAEQLLQVV
ncbi:MAG: methylmalonyl Co-A mutase-associated GTPase MeaB [Chloroflexota bacterium]|nr:methylmalonyl Co-A mutase-associated GTPase MeaB [Chloroflexota bacterium]